MWSKLITLTMVAVLALEFVRLNWPLLVYWVLKDLPKGSPIPGSMSAGLALIYVISWIVIVVTYIKLSLLTMQDPSG